MIDVSENDVDRARVLIADDERGLTDLYRIWLRDDYDVTIAADGEQALEALDASVDVVLLDRRLPGLSGDQVLDEIREGEDKRPVAMLSAVAPDFDVLDMDFDGYVKKPVTSADLRKAVKQLVDITTLDQDARRYFALLSKRAYLRSEKSASELQSNNDYAALEARLDELRQRLDGEHREALEEDFKRIFRR